MKWFSRLTFCLTFVAVWMTCLSQSSTLAVTAQSWVHTTEADFEAGEIQDLLITNLGDLKLAAQVKTLGQLPEDASILYDLQRLPNGTLYLATGPLTKLFVQHDKVLEQVQLVEADAKMSEAEANTDSGGGESEESGGASWLDQTQLFQLGLYQGKLLLGISGQPSRLAVLDKAGQLKVLIELPQVRYIWDMVVEDQKIYLATGIHGALLAVDLSLDAPASKEKQDRQPMALADDDEHTGDEANQGNQANDEPVYDDPRVTVLLNSRQANLLCLASDGKGHFYAGSDTDGLLYRVTLDAHGEARVFVMFDAPEPEIGAILLRKDGTLFIGTADAKQAKPGRLTGAVKQQMGRPVRATSKTPDAPAIPPVPTPPGKPKQPTTDQDKEAGSADTADSNDNEQLAQSDASPTESAEPTADQYDQLRQQVRQRLLQDDADPLAPAPNAPSHASQTQPTQSSPHASASLKTRQAPRKKSVSARKKNAKKGNAVYRIDTDLFVSEIFRETVTIHQLAQHEDYLIVATGNEGQIYRVDPQAQETTILADLEPGQIPTLLVEDGHMLLGTANPAKLIALNHQFTAQGEYTSPILDAKHISRWGQVQLTGNIPRDTSVNIQLRSGNVGDPEDAPWSNWSKPLFVGPNQPGQELAPVENAVDLPPARFMQYRLNLVGSGNTTPVVNQIKLTYVVPNLKPQITSITAKFAGQTASGKAQAAPTAKEPTHATKLSLAWKATDPNRDILTYQVQYRLANTDKWLMLKEDLTANKYNWETHRVPDGWYEVRVTGSDRLSNIAQHARSDRRLSDPILVDNTPPAFTQPPQISLQPGQATLTMSVKDEYSIIAGVHWSVDGDPLWQPSLPQDLIYDSTVETLSITIPDLAPGSHLITLRVTDARGNALYRASFVSIE